MKSLNTNGKRMRELREGKQLTQEELATKSGVSLRTIQRAERGEPLASQMLSYVAGALDVAIDELIEVPTPATEEFQFLPRITRASQLEEIVSCWARYQLHSEPTNDAERHAIGSVLDHVDDYNMVWGDMSAGERLEGCQAILQSINDAEAAGFWTFATKALKEVHTPNGPQAKWPVAYLILARPDDPSVMTKDDDPQVAGLFAMFPLKFQPYDSGVRAGL